MPRHYSAEEVLAILMGISTGGRGGVGGENPLLGIPSLGEAIAQDRARGRGRKSRRGRSRSSKVSLAGLRPKRKVSAYQREFGRQLKKLKRAHPRTPVTKLMKRAHAATKRARRGK